MKYLYLIFRLFFCPHKYHQIATAEATFSYKENPEKKYVRRFDYICQCNYCGKIKTFKGTQ